MSSASVFVDIFDIRSGDRIEEKVREGLQASDELVSLLTPWSVGRNWVWAEMAAAWIQRKRYTGIVYGLTLDEIDKHHGGLAILAPTNVIASTSWIATLSRSPSARGVQPMSEAKHVFVSHAHEDKAFAEKLVGLMRDRGANVFVDGDVKAGDGWSETLRREMQKSSALILFLPSDGVANRNSLWFEAGAARALGKRVIAVRPPKVRLSELPQDVADILVLDADERPLETIADTLVEAVPAYS